MLSFPRWKVWGISLLCLIGSLMAVPSFLPASVFNQLPAIARGTHINLGLDLAGGSQLLLEAQTQDLARHARGRNRRDDAPRASHCLACHQGRVLDQQRRGQHHGRSRPAQRRPRPWPAATSDRWAPWAAPNGPWPRPMAGRSSCVRPMPARTRASARRWSRRATSSTGASTRSARSSRRSSSRAPTASSSRCPACRIRRR